MDISRAPPVENVDPELEVTEFEETITAELDVNLKNILEDYVEGVLHLTKYFSVDTSSGTFRGKIVIFDDECNGKGLDIFMNEIDANKLDVKTYLMLGRCNANNQKYEDAKMLFIDTVGSNTNRISSGNDQDTNYRNGIRAKCTELRPDLKIFCLEGGITLTFKSTSIFKMKQRAKNALIPSRILSKEGNTFDIVCKGETVTFDKELLAIYTYGSSIQF